MNNKISIIIPYFDTPKSLTTFITRLSDNFPIVVVNNASTLPKIPILKKLTAINLSLNSGFAHAANVGAAHSNSDWLLFANSDIALQPDNITALISEAIERKLDALSPILLGKNSAKDINYHQPLPTFVELLRQYGGLHLFWQPISGQTTLPGACLLIKRSVFTEIGGWDERFWLWWEDADLSYRLHKKGFRLAISEQTAINHSGGESFRGLNFSFKKRVFFHSLRIFSHKHFAIWQQFVINLLLLRFDVHRSYPRDTSISTSLIIPNVKPQFLSSFLKNNTQFFNQSKHEVIIVTSAVNALWFYKNYPAVIIIKVDKMPEYSLAVKIGYQRARGITLVTVNDDALLNNN